MRVRGGKVDVNRPFSRSSSFSYRGKQGRGTRVHRSPLRRGLRIVHVGRKSIVFRKQRE